ncbi:MAG: ion transporter [Bacteroidales bacterium]|jgi:voltage-gated potassium channel
MSIKVIRQKIYEIIFEADTFFGKLFDVALFYTILLSVVVVMLNSVQSLHEQYGYWFLVIEWIITLLFTLEYLLRIWVVSHPGKYVYSFYGIIDLLSILPTYLSLILVGSQYLMVIRVFRLLRIFRVLKLVRYVGASDTLWLAAKNSRRKIVVFLEAVLIIVVIIGAMMYLIEGPEHGFSSIPKSVYWAIVTLTTVGYGDIAPQTFAGQSLASLLMITGFAMIAVPTGIITSEINRAEKRTNTQVCSHCQLSHHDDDALYCKACGNKL